MLDLDLHWTRGESHEAARQRAKALQAREAMILAEAYARTRNPDGDDPALSREEVVQFAESLAATSADQARSLAQKLWEARSGERAQELVRSYTATVGEALEAFIAAFEEAKRREVRSYLRENPEALETLREHARATGEDIVASDEAVAALHAAHTADSTAASSRVLRAPSLDEVRHAVASSDKAASVAQEKTTQSLATAATWLEQAASRAEALEQSSGGRSAAAAAASSQLKDWALAAAEGAREGSRAVQDRRLMDGVSAAAASASAALDTAEALSGADARRSVALAAVAEGEARVRSEWEAQSQAVKDAKAVGSSVYSALREAAVSGDTSRVRDSVANAAESAVHRAGRAATEAGDKAASVMELDLSEEELRERDTERQAQAAIAQAEAGPGARVVMQGIAALAGDAAKQTIRSTVRKPSADESKPSN